MKNLLQLLEDDSTLTHAQLAAMTGMTEAAVSSWTSCTGKIRCFSLYFFKIKWVAVPVTPSMGASFSPTNWATSPSQEVLP